MSRVRRAWESEATETRETGFMLRATAVASVRILGSGETPSPSQGRQTPPRVGKDESASRGWGQKAGALAGLCPPLEGAGRGGGMPGKVAGLV